MLGVDQGAALKQPADTQPRPADRVPRRARRAPAYYGQKVATDTAGGRRQDSSRTTVCGYGPSSTSPPTARAGLLKRGIDGRGVTVAITDAYASPTIVADAAKYNQPHHLPAVQAAASSARSPRRRTATRLVDECGAQRLVRRGDPGRRGRARDGARARRSSTSARPTATPAWTRRGPTTIDNHVADIITNSWGNATDDIALLGADYVQFYQQFSLEAALTGITVNFSSGDAGDETAGGTDPAAKTVDFPADLPYVTGVGGTSVGIDKHGQRISSTAGRPRTRR